MGATTFPTNFIRNYCVCIGKEKLSNSGKKYIIILQINFITILLGFIPRYLLVIKKNKFKSLLKITIQNAMWTQFYKNLH